MKEILLTGLALAAFTWYTVRRTIPLLLEWLDCLSVDEMEFRKGYKDE